MEKTWRWFGRKDAITLDMLRQIGVEGIVTALHDIPTLIVSFYAVKVLLTNQLVFSQITERERPKEWGN